LLTNYLLDDRPPFGEQRRTYSCVRSAADTRKFRWILPHLLWTLEDKADGLLFRF